MSEPTNPLKEALDSLATVKATTLGEVWRDSPLSPEGHSQQLTKILKLTIRLLERHERLGHLDTEGIATLNEARQALGERESEG